MNVVLCFDWIGRLGLLSLLIAWGLLSFGVGGTGPTLLLAASFIFSFIFIWFQIRLKVSGRMYLNDPKGFLLSCLLSMLAMVSTPILLVSYFGLIARAH